MMDETFWTVEFRRGTRVSTGVAIFTKGKTFGGDSGHTFMGKYAGDSSIKANIFVHSFVSGFDVMGMGDDYELEFAGIVEGKTMTATANVVGHPENKLTARLTKVTDLPEERTEWSAVPLPDSVGE